MQTSTARKQRLVRARRDPVNQCQCHEPARGHYWDPLTLRCTNGDCTRTWEGQQLRPTECEYRKGAPWERIRLRESTVSSSAAPTVASRRGTRGGDRIRRHPNRENAIARYLKDHLGTDKVRVSENRSKLVIVFCVDDDQARLQHRLQVRHEVITDHGAEQLEDILDAQRVIERMREAGTQPILISSADVPGGASGAPGRSEGQGS